MSVITLLKKKYLHLFNAKLYKVYILTNYYKHNHKFCFLQITEHVSFGKQTVSNIMTCFLLSLICRIIRWFIINSGVLSFD